MRVIMRICVSDSFSGMDGEIEERFMKVAGFLLVLSTFWSVQSEAQQISSQAIWEYPTNGNVKVVTTFPDVTGDGRLEVLAGGADNVVRCLSSGGSAEYREIWSCTALGAINAVEAIGDVNADGFPDAVAGSSDNLVYCISGNPNDGGTEIWTTADAGDIWSVAAPGDVNGDGIGDVVVGTANNNMICISGAAQEQGRVLWQYSSDADFWNVLAVPDVNADGKKDCVGSCDNFVYCFSGAGQGKNAKAVWSAPFDAGARVWALAALPDVTGDFRAEILVASQMDQVDCLSGASGQKLWSFSTGSDARCVAAIKDINGDGKWDVLAGSADDYGYAISGANGQLIWKVALSSTVLAVTALDDVNSDGFADAVFGSDADEIVCIIGGGASKGQKFWSYTTSGSMVSLAAVGDANGNGIADVAAASTDGYVRLFEGNSLILEVELVSFSATVVQDGVRLGWRTAAEFNNLGFEVHRSYDGSNWNQIAFVAGNGTTALQHDYSYHDKESNWGQLYYRIKQLDRDGQSELFPAIKVVRTLPAQLTLHGNYPNPFNAGTFIRYELPTAGEVEVRIYNLHGELVQELWQGFQNAGNYSLYWSGHTTTGKEVASGIYLCTVRTKNEIGWLRMNYLK